MAIITGTLVDDNLRGSEGIDTVLALSGNDLIVGLGGGDVIDGGSGDDVIYSNSTSAWGDDAINLVGGGFGDDTIYGGYGDVLNGGFGYDRLSLDLSRANRAVEIDFRPMTLLDVSDLLVLKIDQTELSGFQAVSEIRGSAFGDRVSIGNARGEGSVMDGAGGNDQLRAGNGEDRLSGGIGSDILLGLGGADRLDGGDARDKLVGGRGQDTLTGGAGNDLFIFRAVNESSRSPDRADVITDFSHADRDRISLAAIDAVTGGDDDAFTFIGSARFSGTAGELQFRQVDGDTFVRGDVDGDGRADFSIRIEGEVDLVARDFQL